MNALKNKPCRRPLCPALAEDGSVWCAVHRDPQARAETEPEPTCVGCRALRAEVARLRAQLAVARRSGGLKFD